jgi:integrase
VRVYLRGDTYWLQHAGRRRSLNTSDKGEAERRARELWRRLADPDYRPTNKATIRAALKAHHTDKKRQGRAPGTLTMIERHGAHIARILGDITILDEIDAGAVDKYVTRRELEGAVAHTVHKELSTLRGVLKSAKRRGEFRGDVAEVIPEYARKWTPGTRALTSGEVLRLLAALPAERRALVAFITATAADLSNALAARKADVDLERWRVIVHGTKTTARRRVVPVAEPFRNMLAEAVHYLPFAPWGNVRRDLAVACKRAGVPRVTPRDLRRTCGAILRNEYGVAPTYIAGVLGHADSRMVELVYGRLETDALARELDARTGGGERTAGATRRKQRRQA